MTLVGVHLENIKTGRVASRVHGYIVCAGNQQTVCGLDIFLTNPDVQFSVVDSAPEVTINCPLCKEKIS